MDFLLTKQKKNDIIALQQSGAVASYHAERSYGEESPGFIGQDNG